MGEVRGEVAVVSSLGCAELAEVGRAVGALAGVVDASGRAVSRAELVEVVAGCQGLVNMLTAVQDVAIMGVAAVEEEWGEDGLVVESRRAPGHVALDAPDVVAGALGVSHLQAQRRVSLAARLAAAGPGAHGQTADGQGAAGEGAEPVVADGEDAASADFQDAVDDAGAGSSGLGGVHAAMRDGRLDGYAASVLGEELEQAPAEVAAAVVGALEGWFGRECASLLRRRCRRVLARVSPDLLRQRAQRARSECGLRRWAEEAGVDRWSGSFPSEQAAMGWAAVDALARRYVTEGVCDRLEQARGKALIDLVTGHASIDVTVVVTAAEDTDPEDQTSDAGPDGPEPDPGPDESAPDAGQHDGAAREVRAATPDNNRVAENDDDGNGGSEDLVEAYGPFAGDAMLVRRSWLAGLLRAGARVRFARCHRRTGALLDDDDAGQRTGATGSAGSMSYRPREQLKSLVRTRDGRCRFPGCSVAARFCDLDHARPWPAGPTTAGNLMCLCRRHHRIKQRPGWSVRLAGDGTATWTDPVGRRRTTWPRNHLDLLILPSPPAPPATAAAAAAASAPPAADTPTPAHPPAGARTISTAHEQASTLETILEVLGDGYRPWTHPDRLPPPGPVHGDLTRPPPARPRLRYHPARTHHHRTHHAARALPPPGDVEPPPF